MKVLTLAFSVQLNDEEDYLPKGMMLQVDESYPINYDGFVAVKVTNGLSQTHEPVTFVPFTDHFRRECFVELN